MAFGNRKIWKTALMVILGLKIGVVGYCLANIENLRTLLGASVAMAEQKQTDSKESDQTQDQQGLLDEFLESLKQRRLAQIQEREEALNQHSEAVRTEEARLKKVEKDLQAVLAELTTIQDSVEQKIKDTEKFGDEQLARLAKVYEETPPEQAGPMLTKLEPRVAAQILIRMNPRKAGKIWGQVSPAEGVKISEELVKLK
jgi:flagellar motility protein MotE (MotC chaperone)